MVTSQKSHLRYEQSSVAEEIFERMIFSGFKWRIRVKLCCLEN